MPRYFGKARRRILIWRGVILREYSPQFLQLLMDLIPVFKFLFLDFYNKMVFLEVGGLLEVHV